MAYFALVPAAGSGARMGSARPKQYLSLAGRPLIHYALTTLAAHPLINQVFVVLSADDTEWARFDWSKLNKKLVVLRCGGASRAESVQNGLSEMAASVGLDDWVLVHDAARPCLTTAHLDALIAGVDNDSGVSDAGGILAIPVADTLKQGIASESANPGLMDRSVISATVPRAGLWQAQTPQMFRRGLLARALDHAGVGTPKGESITDEASAVEALGLKPKLIAADITNLKVTYPLDLKLAEWILQNRKIES